MKTPGIPVALRENAEEMLAALRMFVEDAETQRAYLKPCGLTDAQAKALDAARAVIAKIGAK